MSPIGADPTPQIVRLIGVYDSDGTISGELAAWSKALLGRQRCALASITQGPFGRRREWKNRSAELPVRFDTYHRDDQPIAVRDAAGGRSPVVIVETDVGYLPLLSVDRIASCGGSVVRLVDSIQEAATVLHLAFKHC